MRALRLGASVPVALAFLGCAGADSAPPDDRDVSSMRAREDFTVCTDPRPEMCTQEYVPVCALRQTGAECVEAPCDEAFEQVTKSNGCSACSDGEVLGWLPDACDADPAESPFHLDP